MIILEGADGTGKSTLAHYISSTYKYQIFHCSYSKDWNIEMYHRLILHTAGKLEEQANVPVIIDRWALSELVYGRQFRDGASYNVEKIIQEAIDAYNPKFVICTNDNVQRNFEKLANEREEMYHNASSIQEEYLLQIATGQYGKKYYKYDYDKDRMFEFCQQVLNLQEKAK